MSARTATIAIGGGGSTVVTVNPDSGSISVVDTASLARSVEIAVCRTPQSLALSEGQIAYVVCRDGTLHEVDLALSRTLRSVAVGYDPFGVVIAGGRLLVSVSGEATLLVLDRSSLTTIMKLATEPFPRGMAVHGQTLYLTHFRSGRVSTIDLTTMSLTGVMGTVADANISQSVFVTGGRAYLPQTRSNDGNPALLFDTTVFPIVSVIDLASRQNLNGERLSIDIIDRPSAIPLDAAITSDGKIVVVHAASDDVSVIDLQQKKLVAHIDVGSNPRGVVLSTDEKLAFINNMLSGSISVIDLMQHSVVATVPVTAIPLPAALLNGKILFHTSKRTTLSRDRWMSCASCHFDGATDGRTWFFRDGPRNTTSLFGVGMTQPSHWTGDLDELQDVEATIRVIQAGTGLTSGSGNCTPTCDSGAANSGRSQDLDDLAAFLRALRAPPRNGRSEAATRGEALFLDGRTRCSSCHPPPLFTDRIVHDVGTGQGPGERRGPSFDTPTLAGLSDTAPYLHDGSAATLVDVVRGATGAHGDTTMLSEAETADLAAFLDSIPFVEPPPRRRAVRQ